MPEVIIYKTECPSTIRVKCSFEVFEIGVRPIVIIVVENIVFKEVVFDRKYAITTKQIDEHIVLCKYVVIISGILERHIRRIGSTAQSTSAIITNEAVIAEYRSISMDGAPRRCVSRSVTFLSKHITFHKNPFIRENRKITAPLAI
ncbi:hypothetical protein D3C73_791680 [compost metagenome]